MVKRMIFCMVFGVSLFGLEPVATQAETECQLVEKKKIKVEGYISKKFRKERKKITKEFAEMGNTRMAVRVFPMGETSDVVAVACFGNSNKVYWWGREPSVSRFHP